MTAADLLHSYQDLMPEPADHAEIVRLRAPDFRPETITISLHDVLVGNDTIALQPFDLIRVYGRYEIDPPKVFIYGEVLRSGEYPLAQNMTVAGLVQSAGGFKRSAYRDVADLTSYSVQGNEKVVLEHQSVDLAKALQGDHAADLLLKPGDVVSIRQLNGWEDIGAAITVSGEVAHAGTYGIQAGERLSTVIRRSGGFRENAFPAGALLERVQVRELGEVTRQQMIQRLETTPANVSQGLGSAQDQAALQQAAQQQQQQIIASLRSHPASGRQVIRISSDISKWENTPADIEVRAGDTLKVPKRPNFVIVSGQVYNGTAISYVPGKDVSWYLSRAGGATKSGEKKDLFVVRADGSVVGHGSTWTNSNVLHLRMQPGDSIVVPEKIIGSSQAWKNVVALAQIMSSIAITGAVAGIF
jgi:protein involved in polysaccharide export with SLBB domain